MIDQLMETNPRNNTRVWIAVGVTVVGIVLAVVLFRVVRRSGKGGGSAASASASASACGCAWNGTRCAGPVCELAPKATWTLVPLRATFAVAGGTPASTAPDLSVCTRATGAQDWKCTKPVRAAAMGAGPTQFAEYLGPNGADGTVVVTTEALHDTGIDIEIRRAGTAIATATGLHHPTLKPGAMLFQGGLRFGAKEKGVNDVLYRFTPSE